MAAFPSRRYLLKKLYSFGESAKSRIDDDQEKKPSGTGAFQNSGQVIKINITP